MAVYSDVYNGFITAMKGMAITWKEFMTPAITVQYPKETRQMPERFRGMLVNDASLCIACNKCVKICPVNCIECEGEGKGKERHPSLFTIDYVKCCWCEICVDSCPTNSLFMSMEHELVFRDRSQMIRDFVSNPIPPKSGTKKPKDEKTAEPAKKKTDEAESKPNEETTESGRAAA